MTGLMDMSDVKSFLKFDENGKVRDDLYNYKMIFSHDSKLQGICFNETTRSIVVNGSLPWNSEDGEWGYSDWMQEIIIRQPQKQISTIRPFNLPSRLWDYLVNSSPQS